MGIWAQLDSGTNRLSNIRQGVQQFVDDVPLAAFPNDDGPWTYNAITQLAETVSNAVKLQDQRNRAISAFIISDELHRTLRSLAIVMGKQLNILRQRLRDQDAAVAVATSLADLKSRWATIAAGSPLPDITISAAKQAIMDEINTSESD